MLKFDTDVFRLDKVVLIWPMDILISDTDKLKDVLNADT